MASSAMRTLLFDRDDLAAPVVPARGAGAMRQDRLLALGAQDDLHRLAKFAVRGAPAVAAHLRRALLRNSHGSASLAQFDVFERHPAGIHRLALALALLFVQVVAAHRAQPAAAFGAHQVHREREEYMFSQDR